MKKNDRIKIFTLVALIFSMILIICGVTYALYAKLLKGNTKNIISTGTLYFNYDETNYDENGIKIENAFPIPDSIGKVQIGSRQYFDFSVNGKTTIGDINYEVVAVKQSDSNLDDKFVKVYLTKLEGNQEVASNVVMNNDLVKTFSELQSSARQEGKIIYVGKIENGSTNYLQKFRLRMWISDTTTENDDIYGKTFSVKVNILATQ